jgi:uncharacterized protein YdeI (YjbR/CyaY-like superfamily)
MEAKNVLDLRTRGEFREWLSCNHNKEQECWLIASTAKSVPDGTMRYVDAVEEALCFGWIDSMVREVNGKSRLRFTPRKKKSMWTELNKERCRRLEKLGMMTDAGRAALPDMEETGFVIDPDVLQALKDDPAVWENFRRFPELYQRVRTDNIQRVKENAELFRSRLKRLVDNSRDGKMFGEWDDGGRLSSY